MHNKSKYFNTLKLYAQKYSKFVYVIIILILLSSCYTVKKAQRQVIKADMNYPEMFTAYALKAYPTKDSIIEKIKVVKGADIIKYDTVKEIDCDSIVNDTIIDNKVLIRYKTIYRTDTIETIKKVFKENTSKVTNLNLQINRLEKEKENLKNQLNYETNTKKKYRNWLIGLILLVSVYLVGRFKFGFL